MVVGDVTTAVDLVVLGAGPGGYVAAIRAAQLGRKVTLIDAGSPGGTCLNQGCIPLKALLSASERYVQARGDDLESMGITSSGVSFDWKKMQAWKRSVVQRLSEGVRRLLAGNQVEYVSGFGWFINDQEIRVEGEHGSLRYKFDACIIATGSENAPVSNVRENVQSVLTPEQALALPELPETIAIAGDNYIALELATLFARLGVKTSLYSPGEQILAEGDPTALRLVQASMRKQGITLKNKTNLTDIERGPLVVCARSMPYTSRLHLDAAGISLDPQSGGIAVDTQQRTNQPHIFAIGDCTGGLALASYAMKQGKVAAEVLAGKRVQFAPQVTLLVVHTTPEIAMVGLTPEAASATGYQSVSGRFPLAANGRALTLGTDNGSAQLLAGEDGTLLGATLVGPRAGDLISQLVLALEMGATLTDLDEILYAHPGLGEIILEAAENAQGKAISIVGKK